MAKKTSQQENNPNTSEQQPKPATKGKYLLVENGVVTCLYSKIRGKNTHEKRQTKIGDTKVSEMAELSQGVFDILKNADNSISLPPAVEMKYPSGDLVKFTDKDMNVAATTNSSGSSTTNPTGNLSNRYPGLVDDMDDFGDDFMGRNRRNRGRGNYGHGNNQQNSYFSATSYSSKFYVGYRDPGKAEKMADYVWSSTESKVREALEKAGIEPTTWKPKNSSQEYDLYMVDVAGWDQQLKGRSHSVLTCGFNATKKYIEVMHGGSLDSADERWYKDCSLTEQGGVPLNHACTVINKLVEPYNFRIARVRVRKGMSTHQDAPAWMSVLGINPSAVRDHNISNDDFIEQFTSTYKEQTGNEMPEKDFNELVEETYRGFRFEYHDKPFPGSIIMYSMRSGSSSTPSYASGGGHAEFLSPRASIPAKWQLSIVLARKDQVVYDNPPPEIPPGEYEYILDPWKCMIKDSKGDTWPLKSFDTSSTEWEKRVAAQRKSGALKESSGGGSTQPNPTGRPITTVSPTGSTTTLGSGSGPNHSSTKGIDKKKIFRPANGLYILPQPKDNAKCPDGWALCDDNSYRHYSNIDADSVDPKSLPKGFAGGTWTKAKKKWIFTASEQTSDKWPSQAPTSNRAIVSAREIELIKRSSIMEGATVAEIETRIRELEEDSSSHTANDRALIIGLLQKELAVRKLTSTVS